MSIRDDFRSVVDSWSEQPLFWKILTVTLLVLQFLSVGSIADGVFEFRGFLKNGLEYYYVITQPLRDALQWIEVDPEVFDSLVVFGICVSAYIRSLSFNLVTTVLFLIIGTFLVFVVLPTIVVVTNIYLIVAGCVAVLWTPDRYWNIAAIISAIPVAAIFAWLAWTRQIVVSFPPPVGFLISMMLLPAVIFISDRVSQDRNTAAPMAAFIYSPILLLCTIAAVSEGLAR